MNGVKGEFEPIGNTELIKDVVQVVLYSLLRDEHLLGNFLILVALSDQDDDLALTLTELGALPGGLSIGMGSGEFRQARQTDESRPPSCWNRARFRQRKPCECFFQ